MHNGLVNRAAIKSRLASEGFRTGRDFLDRLDAEVGRMVRQAMRGMGGLGRKTVSVEAFERGALRAS